MRITLLIFFVAAKLLQFTSEARVPLKKMRNHDHIQVILTFANARQTLVDDNKKRGNTLRNPFVRFCCSQVIKNHNQCALNQNPMLYILQRGAFKSVHLFIARLAKLLE